MAALLLDAEAEIDHQNQAEGATALMFACQNSNVEVAKLLLERGANKDLKDNECPQDEHGLDYVLSIAVRKEELLALLARF